MTREPSGGPSTAKMPSENPVLSSTAVVWGEWAAWPLEAPGGYFGFPDNKETHAGLSQPSPTPAQGRGEKQGRGPATVRELRGEARAAHCAGASRRPLGQIGRQGAGAGLPMDLPNPGIESRSPALQADSLPAEPQGKPKNTGVGRLSLLQPATREKPRGSHRLAR